MSVRSPSSVDREHPPQSAGFSATDSGNESTIRSGHSSKKVEDLQKKQKSVQCGRDCCTAMAKVGMIAGVALAFLAVFGGLPTAAYFSVAAIMASSIATGGAVVLAALVSAVFGALIGLAIYLVKKACINRS